MKVVNSCCYLVGNVLADSFFELELSLLHVVEQVAALTLLQNNKYVVLVLEDVQQSNHVWMLADLEHLDLSFLQFEFLNGHMLFPDDLDGHFFIGFQMPGKFHLSELTLSQIRHNFIIVFHLRVANGLLYGSDPLASVVPVSTVVDANLIHREVQLERVDRRFLVQLLFFLALNEHTHQRVHIFVLLVVLLLVAIKFFSKKAVPVLFELVILSLSKHFSFKLADFICVRLDLEVVQHVLFFLIFAIQVCGGRGEAIAFSRSC